MKVLERGGRAAASTMERLRDAQRRLERLEVSLEALILWREEALLAPLLEWEGVDVALRSAVDAVEVGMGAQADDGLRPRRPPTLEPEASHATARTPRQGYAEVHSGRLANTDLGGRQQIGVLSTMTVVPPSRAARRWRFDGGSLDAAEEGGATKTRFRRQGETVLLPHAVVEQRVASILSETAQTLREHERSKAGFLSEPVSRPWPEPAFREDREQVHLVTTVESRRRLDLAFAGDERMGRGWHQPLPTVEESERIAAILGESASTRGSVTDAPSLDPMSQRLQHVVDRAMEVRERARVREGEPSSHPLRFEASAQEEGLRRQCDVFPGPEPAGPTFPEPPRQSGLRRLASLGESMEPERMLSMPSPSLSASTGEPRRRPDASLERDDLAREIADIFRREALRHGIVPEEDAP